MTSIERVSFKQVYDLVFRARNARLNTTSYELDFLDWVKAGIAFNTRGCELGSRKISMFVSLYRILERCVIEGDEPIRENIGKFNDALVYFYEDILAIYQDHLASKQRAVKTGNQRKAPTFGEFLIYPSFADVPWLYSVFNTLIIDVDTYVCQNEQAFLQSLRSPYLEKNSRLYQGMAVMYDYGVGRLGREILLEVRSWDKTM